MSPVIGEQEKRDLRSFQSDTNLRNKKDEQEQVRKSSTDHSLTDNTSSQVRL